MRRWGATLSGLRPRPCCLGFLPLSAYLLRMLPRPCWVACGWKPHSLTSPKTLVYIASPEQFLWPSGLPPTAAVAPWVAPQQLLGCPQQFLWPPGLQILEPSRLSTSLATYLDDFNSSHSSSMNLGGCRGQC
jgi:hypothetical protein